MDYNHNKVPRPTQNGSVWNLRFIPICNNPCNEIAVDKNNTKLINTIP